LIANVFRHPLNDKQSLQTLPRINITKPSNRRIKVSFPRLVMKHMKNFCRECKLKPEEAPEADARVMIWENLLVQKAFVSASLSILLPCFVLKKFISSITSFIEKYICSSFRLHPACIYMWLKIKSFVSGKIIFSSSISSYILFFCHECSG
jgi:hypothetical protein